MDVDVDGVASLWREEGRWCFDVKLSKCVRVERRNLEG